MNLVRPKKLSQYRKMSQRRRDLERCKLLAEQQKAKCDLTYSRKGSKKWHRAEEKIRLKLGSEFHKLGLAEQPRGTKRRK